MEWLPLGSWPLARLLSRVVSQSISDIAAARFNRLTVAAAMPVRRWIDSALHERLIPMRIATSLLAATAMSLAALMPVPVTAQTALCNGPCLLTGGERGD